MTKNTIPTSGASFSADLTTFLQEEDADRFKDMFTGFVLSGGTHSTGASLTQTPASLTAYPGGHYITETGSITYPDDTTHIWVICHKDTTTAITNWTRVSGTHYLFRNTGSGTPPTLPTDTVFLMKVTTSSGSVTAVQDARILSFRGVHLKTSDPTSTDDENLQYRVNDLWTNTSTPETFVLTDATGGAAIWNSAFVNTTSVDNAGAVMETDYDAQTVLIAISDDTPTAITIPASNFVGRKASGDAGVMSATEARTVLNVENGATADQTGAEIKTAYEAEANAYTDTKDTKLSGIETGATNDTWTNSGAIDLTSGSPTAVSLLSSLPAGVSEIEIYMSGVSTNTANQAPMIQIGDSGGLETTGYNGSGFRHTNASDTSSANSSGFLLSEELGFDAAIVGDFIVKLSHMGGNVWILDSHGNDDANSFNLKGLGDKTLSGVLDRVTITTSGGAATFDGGTAYARYK